MTATTGNALLPPVVAISVVALLAACGSGSDDCRGAISDFPNAAGIESTAGTAHRSVTSAATSARSHAPPVDPTPVAPAEEACGDWEELRHARYVYKNNVWNKGAITGYEQCVMRRVVDGEDQYGWRWSWPYQGFTAAALSPSVNYHEPGIGVPECGHVGSYGPVGFATVGSESW